MKKHGCVFPSFWSQAEIVFSSEISHIFWFLIDGLHEHFVVKYHVQLSGAEVAFYRKINGFASEMMKGCRSIL